MSITIQALEELTEIADNDLIVVRDDSETTVEPVKKVRCSTLQAYFLQGDQVDTTGFVALDQQGRLPAVDGSLLTNLSASQISGLSAYSDARARTAQSGHSVGGVGSYALAGQVSSTARSAGGAISGSHLRYAAAASGTNDYGSSLPGTWRCMGDIGVVNSQFSGSTLWLRIA